MGAFYVNFVARGSESGKIVQTLESWQRDALVSPTINDLTFFYDACADEQDEANITHLGQTMSAAIAATVLAALNHDDDLLLYWLFVDGNLIDQYNSWPGYFSDGSRAPSGGDAAILCNAFAAEKEAAVRAVLHEQQYAFASDQHRALCELLGVPWALAHAGYEGMLQRQDIDGRVNLPGLGDMMFREVRSSPG